MEYEIGIEIANDQITGEILVDLGVIVSLTYSGTVSIDGTLNAEASLSGFGTFATFTGSLSGNSGSGTWQDNYIGCSGTWVFTK